MDKSKMHGHFKNWLNIMETITLTEESGNFIDVVISNIRRYRGTDFPKNGTWIEMNSGAEFRVIESFETVDKLVEENN